MFGDQVCKLILGVHVVGGDLALSTSSLVKEDLSAMYFAREEYVRLPVTCNVEMLTRYNGMLLNYFLKPSSTIILEQNPTSVIVSAAATSSTSIVNCSVRLWRPTLKLIGPLASISIYENVDLPSSGLLFQFASE